MVRKGSHHPPLLEMVFDAIFFLKEKDGSSFKAIKKYIAGTCNVDVAKQAPLIKKHVKAAVKDGFLIQTKGTSSDGSFKLSTANKKRISKTQSKAATANKKAKTKTLRKQRVTIEEKEALVKKTTTTRKSIVKSLKTTARFSTDKNDINFKALNKNKKLVPNRKQTLVVEEKLITKQVNEKQCKKVKFAPKTNVKLQLAEFPAAAAVKTTKSTARKNKKSATKKGVSKKEKKAIAAAETLKTPNVKIKQQLKTKTFKNQVKAQTEFKALKDDKKPVANVKQNVSNKQQKLVQHEKMPKVNNKKSKTKVVISNTRNEEVQSKPGSFVKPKSSSSDDTKNKNKNRKKSAASKKHSSCKSWEVLTLGDFINFQNQDSSAKASSKKGTKTSRTARQH